MACAGAGHFSSDARFHPRKLTIGNPNPTQQPEAKKCSKLKLSIFARKVRYAG
jgi:hypothetical protein